MVRSGHARWLLLALLALLACQARDERASSPPLDTLPEASVVVATTTLPHDSQPRRGEGDDYIAQRTKVSMAWIVPPHRLLAERRLATVRTLGSRGVETWTYSATIPIDSANQLRRKQHVACDSDGQLYAYDAAGPALEYAERVLLIDSAGVDIRSAAVRVATDSAWLPGGAAHRDTAFGAAAGDEFYSLHATYDTSAAADEENGTHGVKYLVQRALFLRAPNGKPIASEETPVAPVECDGCGTPTISDPFGSVFDVIQVLRIPGFPHPVLLLDTSTVEGRALSLVTFDDAGARRDYRLYEYVVNCF